MTETENIKRVFVLEDSDRYDTRNAEEYGARVFINPASSPFTPEKFMGEIIKTLETYHYDPDVDFILMAGPVQALALYIGTVMSEWLPINLLLYHAPSEKYQAKVAGQKYIVETVEAKE